MTRLCLYISEGLILKGTVNKENDCDVDCVRRTIANTRKQALERQAFIFVDSLTSYSRMIMDYFSLQAIFQVINFITVTQTNSVIHGQSVSLTSVFVRAGIMEMENIAVKVQNYMVPSFTRPLSERAKETLDQMVKGRNEDAP